MHRTRGHRPPARRSLPTQRGRSIRSPAIPRAVRVGTRFSPRVAAAGSRRDTDDELAESQPLLSPDTGPSTDTCYQCDWHQLIPCTMTDLAPLRCQSEGCEVLVHHICQSAWESREGHDDVVARYCFRHHPNFNNSSQLENGSVERVQEVLARARIVNVESQITTTESVDEKNSQCDERTPATLQSEYNDYPDRDIDLDAVVLEERYFSGDDEGGDILAHEDEDNYGITDYTAGQFDIHDRVNHFMGAVPISLQNRVAVEAAYMVEALTTVRSMRSMRKTEIAPLVHDKYKSLIRMIPLQRFADATVRVKMVEKYFRAKTNSPEGFYTKACDVMKGVRALATVIKGVGSPLHQIPSGKSLMDMKIEFILKKYSAAMGTVYVPSNNAEDQFAEIPDGWWMLHSSTNLLLAVLVHRCNPDITGDPTEVAPGVTRQSIRAGTREDLVERRERDRIVENHGSERQRVESSIMSSKAALMAQTIDSGAIDQVKEQLMLLAQFKDSYIRVQDRATGGKGEDDFDQTAHDLLSELPFLKKRRLDGNSDNLSTSTAGRKSN